MRDDFVAVILTHGRADRVITIDSLQACGYTGPILLLCDDIDENLSDYKDKYGDMVSVFDKREWASRTDTIDNFDEMGAVVFARNAVFETVKERGFRYFIMLDDDYTSWMFRFDNDLRWETTDIKIRNLDRMFDLMVEWMIAMPRAKAICLAQGGDYIGGGRSTFSGAIRATRKAMNTFVCDVERPIEWIGRINEDVNTYCTGATRGDIYFTLNHAAINQRMTQQNKGGLTDIYLSLGTYVKSFYTVICHPSGATVNMITGGDGKRLHHHIDWNRTTPMILSETVKKAESA